MRVCETCHTPYRSSIDFCGLDGTRLVNKEGDPLKGVVIDRYRLIERLGGGGMAAVYKAQHETIDRVVAIKLLYGELASNKEFAERFRREAQASSKIKHKNVVEVVDFGTTEHGASFLIMELLRGHTLGSALSAAGTFTPARAARVVRDVAAGLAAAHDLGFIHRDLKPGNIMLVQGSPADGGEETAKIVDFGLVGAEPLSSTSEDEQKKLTQSGVTMGTPHYMAPEQIAGMGCTAQSDLYSLGVVLHELLTGAAPFHGSLGEILVQHAHQAPPPLAPAQGLEKIAAKLLEKEPRRRPRDAQELLALIDKTGLVPPSSSSSSASRSSSTEDLLSALGPAAMTETALRAPPIPPSTATLAARPPQRSWRGAAFVVVIGAAAVAAVVVANGNSASAVADAGPVKATQDKVAAAALDAARALVVQDSVVAPVDSAVAVVDDKARAKARADVDAALAARGFDRHDAANIAAVAAAVDAFEADGSNAAAVVTAIAGARVDAGLVRKKIDRVAQLATSKRQKKQVEQLAKELGKRSSEAERGQLMLKLQRLAAELERANDDKKSAPADDKKSAPADDKKSAPDKKNGPDKKGASGKRRGP